MAARVTVYHRVDPHAFHDWSVGLPVLEGAYVYFWDGPVLVDQPHYDCWDINQPTLPALPPSLMDSRGLCHGDVVVISDLDDGEVDCWTTSALHGWEELDVMPVMEAVWRAPVPHD